MNVAAKVALEKEKYPDRFCPAPRCLWRTTRYNHETGLREPLANCPGGRCPRHQVATSSLGEKLTGALKRQS